VQEKLREIMKGSIQVPDEIRDDTHMVKDLGADSLDLLEVMMAVENTFQIKIPDKEFPQLMTVGGAIAYIRAKTSL
jgi:acyl carrier protein